jgi:hypothetical protein
MFGSFVSKIKRKSLIIFLFLTWYCFCIHLYVTICMKLDPGMHIGLHLVLFGKTSVTDYDQSRSMGYGKMCNVDLGLLVVTDQESGKRPHPLANIRRMRWPLYSDPILKQSTPTTGRRVLLSGGSNQYKLAVFSVFRVLMCDLRVLSLRLLPIE